MQGALGVSLWSGGLVSSQAASSDRRTFAAYLDSLLPNDELGPGALRLGVLEQIEAAAAQSAEYRRLVELGCAWLDEQAAFFGAKDFGALGENERGRIVLLAAERDPGSLPRSFFDLTRDAAFRIYWAKPEAWAAIGYGGPPQPDGFVDYALPPAKR